MISIWSICIEEIYFLGGRDLGTVEVSNLFFSRCPFPYSCSLCNWTKGWFQNFLWFFFPLRCFVIWSTTHILTSSVKSHLILLVLHPFKMLILFWYFCFSILIYLSFPVFSQISKELSEGSKSSEENSYEYLYPHTHSHN